jgi:hypothetical protein
MTALFRVETVFVTLFGYPMSYLEFAGTVFNLWSVWLVARKNILTWPVGVVGVILFAILLKAPTRRGWLGPWRRATRSSRRPRLPASADATSPARRAQATMPASPWISSSTTASS